MSTKAATKESINTMEEEDEMMNVKEASLQEMLRNLMEDNALVDVSLEGTDGVTIQAARCVLAARSEVFHKMLFSGFQEKDQPVVKLGFHSSILKAVVEYIHTDTAAILQGLKTGKDNNSEVPDAKRVQAIVPLMEASNYFQLSGLYKKTSKLLTALVESHPALAFAVLEACQQEGPSAPKKIEEHAWKITRAIPEAKITSDAVSVLTPISLVEILKERDMKMFEYQLFKLLWLWAEANPHYSEARRQIASGLSHHIHYLEALTAHESIPFNSLRGLPEWKQVPGLFPLVPHYLPRHKCAVLNFPSIAEGNILVWTLIVEACLKVGDLWLGMFNLMTNRFVGYTTVNEWFSISMTDEREGGMFCTRADSLGFGQGSAVKFVLNLSAKDTLSVAVDGGPTQELWTGLSREARWVPAIVFKNSSGVRLVSTEKK